MWQVSTTGPNVSIMANLFLLYCVPMYLFHPCLRLLEALVECLELPLACLEEQASPLAWLACQVCQDSPQPVQQLGY